MLARFGCLYFYTAGYLFIRLRPISGEYYRQCYNVSNYQHCLSTDVTKKTWWEAREACRANNSVLISVTSSDIQSVTELFRSYIYSSYPAIDDAGVWINVSTDAIDSFHWTTGDRGTPTVDNQNGFNGNRFGAITINNNQFAFYAQTWNTQSFYVCQNTGAANCNDGFQRNSVCYRKYNSETVTWYTASSKCLSLGGSLATFNDLTTPNSDHSLTSWLNITGTTGYWIGLVRRWFVTTDQDGSVVDVQYSNWESGNPSQPPDDNNRRCVLLKVHNFTWIDYISCSTDSRRFICQVKSQLSSTTATTTASTTTTTTKMASSTQTISVKQPSSLTSTSANAVGGSPDGRSSTAILVNNEHTSNTSMKQPSTSNAGRLALGVGIGVGVGVPVIIAIIVVVVVVMIKCRQKKSTQHVPKPANDKKQKAGEMDKDGGSTEMMESIEVIEGSLSTQHLIVNNNGIYADIVPIRNHAVYENPPPANTDAKQQPLPDLVYADVRSVVSQNGQQNCGGNVSPTLSTTAA